MLNSLLVSSRGYNAPMKRHDCFGLRLVVQ